MRIDSFRSLASRNIHIDWIVENFISPGGFTFLVGETGSGKSMLCIQLCDALQNAKSFLGHKTRQHNCLYVQADAGLIEWQAQLDRLAKDSLAWTAYDIERGWLDREADRKLIRSLVWGTYPEDDRPNSPSQVLKHVPFDFIVFDCLHAITDGDLNTKTAMSNVLRWLDEIVTTVTSVNEETKQRTIERKHYLLIHHPNAVVRRGATAGSGHKGFSDACSTKLVLDKDVLYLEKSKITSKKTIELSREPSTGRWLCSSELLEQDFLSPEDYKGLLK